MSVGLTRLRRFTPGVSFLSWRRAQDRAAGGVFFIIAALPPLLAVLLIVALLARSWPILETKPVWALLAGQIWKPFKGEFGFYPFIIGTLWVTVVAMVLAVPPCLLSAIYLVEYARPSVRVVIKPLLDLLAGIPSVVYGVWGMVAVVPAVQAFARPLLSRWFGSVPLFASKNPTGYGVLSGGVVLAVMVAPVIIAVVYEVLQSIPLGLREASLAVGATRWQTVKYAVLPRALPGVIAAVVLGFSRAFGETMAVLMVVGNVPQVPSSIFDAAYPLTALIANNYGEMMSIPLYDAALMGAALVLLLIVLGFNILATVVLHQVARRSKA
ncbi:MAG: phosphate ABC transporter permease subunit PstC [Thermoflexales bacterium]|nr:phosphate ABC transporter permease subunit PstC [Thermoflexales bacterium]